MALQGKMELEPLRDLNDFIVKARFQVPEVANLERWNKRVKENLIYYQTNYFLSATIIFLIVGLLHPQDMLIGTAATVGAFFACSYIMENQSLVADFKKRYPLVALLGAGGLGYMIVSLISSVLVFTFGILLPIIVIFIHASFRLRDPKSKVSNLVGKLSMKKTPMGSLLDALDMPFEGFTDWLADEAVRMEMRLEREIKKLNSNKKPSVYLRRT